MMRVDDSEQEVVVTMINIQITRLCNAYLCIHIQEGRAHLIGLLRAIFKKAGHVSLGYYEPQSTAIAKSDS